MLNVAHNVLHGTLCACFCIIIRCFIFILVELLASLTICILTFEKSMNQMKYSKYFSQIVKDTGTPNLSKEGFAKMMNIIFSEGQLHAFKKVSKVELHKYDIMQFDVDKQLTALTGNIEPKELLQQLLLMN
ncbi:MAG: hypothetical protein ACJA1C_001202 [Crocinitomicaceae bacterium]|jgi:hypothetical protein